MVVDDTRILGEDYVQQWIYFGWYEEQVIVKSKSVSNRPDLLIGKRSTGRHLTRRADRLVKTAIHCECRPPPTKATIGKICPTEDVLSLIDVDDESENLGIC